MSTSTPPTPEDLVDHRPRRGRRRRLLLALLTLTVGTAWLGWAALWSWLRQEVDRPRASLQDDWYSGHRVLDREGQLLRELPAEHGRRGQPLPLTAIGARLITATVIAEDARFFDHAGVDTTAIARAAGQNFRHGRVVSGASTITQQLVKLVDTRGQPGARTPWVKLREAARARNLDDALDKEEILEQYLNRLPYGHGLTGPEAAAQGYFGVEARRLSWAQAAYLAVLPRLPPTSIPTATTTGSRRGNRSCCAGFTRPSCSTRPRCAGPWPSPSSRDRSAARSSPRTWCRPCAPRAGSPRAR